MSLSSFFSSFVSTIHADAPADDPAEKEESLQENSAEAEEEEEEEPEDALPALQEECQQGKCAAAAKHFAHCEEKVNAGEGFPHEDCVEEFMMHCVDACVAPKLFSNLK
ncbi:UQCRH/QCR6 family protein [Abortiporus biennis]